MSEWKKDRKTENNTLVDSLIPGLDDILGLRDVIGAKKRDVFILTRTWTGDSPGVGLFKDEISQVLPSPYLIDYSHNIMIHEAGAIRSGDILIKMISKKSYPKMEDVDLRISQDTLNVQKFYFINNVEYQVIHVKDEYVYWDVQVRKLTDETSKVATT